MGFDFEAVRANFEAQDPYLSLMIEDTGDLRTGANPYCWPTPGGCARRSDLLDPGYCDRCGKAIDGTIYARALFKQDVCKNCATFLHHIGEKVSRTRRKGVVTFAGYDINRWEPYDGEVKEEHVPWVMRVDND